MQQVENANWIYTVTEIIDIAITGNYTHLYAYMHIILFLSLAV